jgi:hypothetical protein
VADRIQSYAVTVPAGTAIATPVTTATSFVDGAVQRIEVVVPPGPSGLVGWGFAYGGQLIIPDTEGQWIVTDDEKIGWDIHHFPSGKQWQLRAYNLDVYDHVIYVRYLIDEFTLPPMPPPAPIPIGA